MSVPANLKRQWIPIAGGSCDVRMGYEALDQAATLFKAAVGSPRRCLVVVRSSADEELMEQLRRQLVDAGFEVCWHLLEGERVRTLDAANQLIASLDAESITKDDLCCAFGDVDVLSLASYACSLWCSGVSFVAIPTDEVALLEGALAPRALDRGEKREILSTQTSARHALLDYGIALAEPGSERSLYTRTLMVSAAMCDSERTFSELWDRADALASGDEEAMITQLLATAKARGQALSSTAAAIRQSLEYGQSFARALELITGTRLARSARLAEGLRFSARLAVGLEKISVDDMLAQDELLDLLGIGTVSCDISADLLIKTLKDDAFLRTNRFMLLVPYALGRVRLATIPDELLREHATAWCAAHGTNA